MAAQLQQMRNGQLSDGRRGIAGAIADQDPQLLRRGGIDYVIPRGQNTDQLGDFALAQRLPIQPDLIDIDDLRVADARQDILRRRPVIDGDLASSRSPSQDRSPGWLHTRLKVRSS